MIISYISTKYSQYYKNFINITQSNVQNFNLMVNRMTKKIQIYLNTKYL